jgi:hypothetical protein
MYALELKASFIGNEPRGVYVIEGWGGHLSLALYNASLEPGSAHREGAGGRGTAGSIVDTAIFTVTAPKLSPSLPQLSRQRNISFPSAGATKVPSVESGKDSFSVKS